MDTGFADEKHIILQFGRLKSMTECATIPSTIDASLIKHQDIVFKASGWGFSLPVRRRLPDDLGKGYIDWIIPDDLAEESDTAVEVLKQANILADVIPYIHQEVYFDDFKKSNEAKVKTLEESLTNIKDTVKAMAVENDLLRMTITRLTRHGGKLENLNKHGLRELIYYAIPSLAGFLIGGPGGWGLEGSFGGVVLGLFVGAWLNSRGR
jgi:hypothetical protein